MKAFISFYNRNIKWFKSKILAERKKFITHLAQKLNYLRKNENVQKLIGKKWQEILKENLCKNMTLSLNEKSKINKIFQKKELTEGEIKELISILSKLPTKELVSLLGENFRKFTQNYIK